MDDGSEVKKLWEGHKIFKKYSNCFDVYSVASKQEGDLSNNLWPFQKTLSLKKVWFIYLYHNHFKIDTKGFVSFITQSFKCGLPKGVLTWITCCGLQNIEALTASNVWLRRYVWQMSCYIPNQCNFRSRTFGLGLQNSKTSRWSH